MLFVCAALVIGLAHAGTWIIKGTGTYKAFNETSTQPIARSAYDFTVRVGVRAWNILTIEQEQTKSQPVRPVRLREHLPSDARISEGNWADYSETGTDGTNVFHVVSVREHSQKLRQHGVPVQNDVVALVEPGPVPQVDDLFHTILWLAFASGDYFQHRPKNKIELLFPGGVNSPELLHRRVENVTATWKLANNPDLPVPMRADSLDPGIMLSWTKGGQDSWALSPRVIKWAAPFDRGFTNWEYRVTATTNISGNDLPLAVEWRFFSPVRPQPGASPRLFASMLIEVKAHTIEAARETITLPAIRGIALVAEHRFEADSSPVYGFSYNATNGWRSEADVRQSKEYRYQVDLQLKVVPLLRRQAGNNILFRQSITIVALTAPILLVWLLRKQRLHPI